MPKNLYDYFNILICSEFHEVQRRCSIHIASSEYKRKKPEWKKILTPELKEIISCVCALLNDVGGVVRLLNVQYAFVTPKDLNDFTEILVKKLRELVLPLTYAECFDLLGNYKDEELFLFVKRSTLNGQPLTVFVKSNLWLRDDHGVKEASGEKVVHQLDEKYFESKAKETKEINYNLKELPIFKPEFFYGSKIQDFQESKRIEFKAAKKKGVAGIRNLKNKIKSNISAFANTEGGHIFIGVEDDLNIEGINCEGKENEITEEITSIIQEMKWGSESITPVKGLHWNIAYYKVKNSPDGAQVIVISVAGLKGIGGVYVDEPESYKLLVTDLATSLQNLELDDVQQEVRQKKDFEAKGMFVLCCYFFPLDY